MLIGNTVRFRASFYNFADEAADPSDVTVNIYAHIHKTPIETKALPLKNRRAFITITLIPDDVDGDLVFEFIGTAGQRRQWRGKKCQGIG